MSIRAPRAGYVNCCCHGANRSRCQKKPSQAHKKSSFWFGRLTSPLQCRNSLLPSTSITSRRVGESRRTFLAKPRRTQRSKPHGFLAPRLLSVLARKNIQMSAHWFLPRPSRAYRNGPGSDTCRSRKRLCPSGKGKYNLRARSETTRLSFRPCDITGAGSVGYDARAPDEPNRNPTEFHAPL